MIFFSEFILHNFNNLIFDATFPSELRKADVIPVFKKKDRKNVENYRPASILPNLSKIYERCLYDQMYKHFSHILSKWQCGFFFFYISNIYSEKKRKKDFLLYDILFIRCKLKCCSHHFIIYMS